MTRARGQTRRFFLWGVSIRNSLRSNNKAASLLRLLSFKVSNRHGLAKYADMQGGTLVSPPSHLTDSSRKWTNIAREYDSCAHRRCWTAAASCPYYSCRRRAKPVGLVLPSVYCSRTRCCAIRFVDDESRALFFGG